MKLLPAPGSAERTRLVWLGGVLVVLAVVFWMRRAPAQPTSAAAPAAVAERSSATGPLPVPELIRLASLEDVAVLGEAGRNPFGFGVRPAPPAPPPAPMPARLPQFPSAPVPTVPQGPPPIGLKLTGMTIPVEGGRTMVTLKDPASSAVFQAYEGDVVDGRYRVIKVGVQSVVVSYVDGSAMRTIPLGG